jgi:hypothetical protein
MGHGWRFGAVGNGAEDMTRGDKAAFRLTIGLGLAVFVAYGLGLQAPFVVCIMALLVLCKPGPPLPIVKAMVIAGVFAALVAAGVLMVPLLENYASAGVLLTAVLLFGLFYMGQLRANPLTTVLVLAFTMIPVAGVQEQALVGVLAGTLAVGVLVGGAVSAASNAIFPDPPAAKAQAKPSAAPDRDNAHWVAWRGTLIVMPVFVLALTNPSFYMAAIMKTVALGQQAGETDARHAGRELVGSTLTGALIEDSASGKSVLKGAVMRTTLFVGVALYAWATVWALERWRARSPNATVDVLLKENP